MKILIDMHHMSLFRSLQLLFEERLKWEVYRPIGLEWFTEGFWNVYPHINTARQFLGIEEPVVSLQNVNGQPLLEAEKKNLHCAKVEDGLYLVRDNVYKNTYQNCITLDRFKQEKFDVLLSSIPQHIDPYNRLISLYQPQAKHIFQVGNAWGHLPGVKNILSSTAPFAVPNDINICFYHQEFDLKQFSYEPPQFHNIVHSYVHYMRKPELMVETNKLLPGWQFNPYGAGMQECLQGMDRIAQAYKDSAFTWHYKPEGDGYGYGIHCSYACGRPVITWRKQYKGKLADRLFITDQTCIDADGLSARQLADKLLYFSKPDRHLKMCEDSYNQFKKVVNFDKDFENIKVFLANLK